MGAKLHVRTSDGIRESADLGEIPALLADRSFFWLDMDGDDPAGRDVLTGLLKLHPMAVEDIFQDRLIPKVEDYGDYLYVVVHGVSCEHDEPEDVRTVEMDIVFSERWLVSHHCGELLAIDELLTECARNPRLLEKGPGFLAHAIMDHLVDSYGPVIDAFDRQVDAVETSVVEHAEQDVLQKIFKLKRSLQKLRRIAMHQREVLLRLSRGEFDLVPEKSLPFFRDIHDHFVRVSDLADGYRELLSGALDAYLSVVSNRMNEVMKTLTLVATLMLPLTFVAGVYGMNFKHMPELEWQYGYAFALGIMLAITVGMVAWFRHKRWV